MKDSSMKARISQLHKAEAQWALMPNFVPLSGELIIFDPDEQHKYARVKIGDGNTPLRNLTFVINSATNDFITDSISKIIDGGRITYYKK
jgi:hypothetical protein